MKPPIIGIVARPGKIFSTIDTVATEETNRNMILRFGGVPIMIMPPQQISYDSIKPRDVKPLTDDEKNILVDELMLCDGILMPGGLKSYSYDYFIDDYARENNIPILGECLGMQIMARNHNGAKIIKNDSTIKHYNKDSNIICADNYIFPEFYVINMLQECKNQDLVQSLVDFVGNYTHIPTGDLRRLANWGIYNGKPVIIDIGLDDDVMTTHYSR